MIVLNRLHGQLNLAEKNFDEIQIKYSFCPEQSTRVNLTEVVITGLVKVLRKLRPSKTKPKDRNRRPTRKKRKKKMQICDFPCLVNVPTPSCLPLYVRFAAGRAAWFSDFQTRVSFRDTSDYAIPSAYFNFFYISIFVVYPTLR